MSEKSKSPKWVLIVMCAALTLLGFAVGSMASGSDTPAPSKFRCEQNANRADGAVDPGSDLARSAGAYSTNSAVKPTAPWGSKASTEQLSASTEQLSASTEQLSASVWEKAGFADSMMGVWEGPEHKPLPNVKIAKPHPDRKFKAERPDYNVKFRIPMKGLGLYEGGCDVYVSGLAFCRVHDPADKATYKVGKDRDGVMEAEVKGASLRLVAPGGVAVELVRKPEGGPKAPRK